MIVNFYNLCSQLFDVNIEHFNFAYGTRFIAHTERGITNFEITGLMLTNSGNGRYIKIDTTSQVWPGIKFDDPVNTKNFKKSIIELDKLDTLNNIFGERK